MRNWLPSPHYHIDNLNLSHYGTNGTNLSVACCYHVPPQPYPLITCSPMTEYFQLIHSLIFYFIFFFIWGWGVGVYPTLFSMFNIINMRYLIMCGVPITHTNSFHRSLIQNTIQKLFRQLLRSSSHTSVEIHKRLQGNFCPDINLQTLLFWSKTGNIFWKSKMWGSGLFLFDIHSDFSISWFSTAVHYLYLAALQEMPYVLYHAATWEKKM